MVAEGEWGREPEEVLCFVLFLRAGEVAACLCAGGTIQ